mgnify:CR=1 FL=1
MSAVRRQNMNIDPQVFEDFCNYAAKKDIKISTWVTIKMKEFIEEEKGMEELKENRKRIEINNVLR